MARWRGRADVPLGTMQKSERFELIFQLKSNDENLIIEAACEALEVSKSGYYEYLKTYDNRENGIDMEVGFWTHKFILI